MNLTPTPWRLACALSAFAAVLAAPPAHAQSRAEQLLSDRPAPRRGCSVATVPRDLPALAQLADSAALAASVADFARRYPVSGGHVFGLFSIAFNELGAPVRVKALDYLLPQGKAEEFESLVGRALRPQPAGHSFTVRLRIEPEGTPVFRIGRSEICEPDSNTRFSVEWNSLENGRRPVPPRVRAYVDANGNVGDVQVLRGSGSDELDRWVQNSLRRARYMPALVDGEAVPMAKEEVVQIRTRG